MKFYHHRVCNSNCMQHSGAGVPVVHSVNRPGLRPNSTLTEICQDVLSFACTIFYIKDFQIKNTTNFPK